jgi:hypothetical protein
VLSRQVAVNREEVDHGCSPEESEEVEIEKEGQEGRTEEKESRAALQSEAQVRCKEKIRTEEEESGREKEICTEEARAGKAGRVQADSTSTSASAGRASTGRIAEPDHLSPVQPAGGRRQSG